MERADRLKPLVPPAMTLPGMALRWILENKSVSTIIPGMRKETHVRANLAASDAKPLTPELMHELRATPLGPCADRMVAVARLATPRTATGPRRRRFLKEISP